VIDPYYVQEPEDWAQVGRIRRADRILVIRQYRHGAKSIFTELPCGGIEQGEPPSARQHASCWKRPDALQTP